MTKPKFRATTASLSLIGSLITIAGCATTSAGDSAELSVADTNTTNPVTIKTKSLSLSNEAYAVLDEGPCERSWIGNHVKNIIVSRFKPGDQGTSSIQVKPNRVTTVSFGYRMSNTTCSVAGSFFAEEGSTYSAKGQLTFSGGILPTSTGCTLSIVNERTGQNVPLLPSIVSGGLCTP